MRKAGSRRESLSLFANDLHISSGNDSGDEGGNLPQTPGVVRRVVTRRDNLLPKSRQFGRIRAELFEEAAPVDSEFRREAEIIRQVRESDTDLERPSNTAQSSPNLLPTVPGLDGPLEGVPEEGSESNMSLDGSTSKGLFGALDKQRILEPTRRTYSTAILPSRRVIRNERGHEHGLAFYEWRSIPSIYTRSHAAPHSS